MSKAKSNGVESTPIEQPKEGTEQLTEGKIEVKRAFNSPRTPQNTWILLKAEFDAGTYLSQKELAKKYGVNYTTLRTRMVREKWNEKQRTLQNKVEQIIEKKVLKEVSEVDSYLKRSYLRSQKYEALIDKSIAQNEDILPPGDIDAYTRSEMRIAELSRIALRIPVLSSLDVTTGGQDLGTSFVQAIQKLRSSEAPKLQEQDLTRVLEAEVE